MKLAEALILRADQQKRLAQLKTRLLRNIKVQEGDQPAENPEQLLVEVNTTAAELLRLIQRINATNSATVLTGDLTIADAIAQRDVLRLQQSLYSDLADAASIQQDRSTRSEVKFRSTVVVTDIQKTADDLAKSIRLLDAQIQASNWTTELSE